MIKIQLHKRLHSALGKMHLDIDLNIQEGTFLTLYGKSGAGKTSILRMLAGLMKPDAGYLEVKNIIWYDFKNKINLGPQKRNFGFVFQDYGLFPNMTVRENLEFALLKNQDEKIIRDLIEIIELGDLQNQKPTRLSGGQQQRVALARSLVQKPDLLLLDEPLSALDQEMRQKLQQYLLRVHTEYKLTTILVSHDVPEILKLSTRIAQLDQGKIVKVGSPNDFINENKMGNDIPLDGKIISIEKEENNVILTIQLNNKLVKIKLPKEDWPILH